MLKMKWWNLHNRDTNFLDIHSVYTCYQFTVRVWMHWLVEAGHCKKGKLWSCGSVFTIGVCSKLVQTTASVAILQREWKEWTEMKDWDDCKNCDHRYRKALPFYKYYNVLLVLILVWSSSEPLTSKHLAADCHQYNDCKMENITNMVMGSTTVSNICLF